ncbi:MAG: hypothetical protein M0P47_12875, partial [Bacteroidales bacterium]|nr:hypothetical protein [Bacteroidales bacterium]MCK9220924.1 hypothetical protein [Bacteroidales bacterium]
GSGIAGSFLTDVTSTAIYLKIKPAGFFYLNNIEAFSGTTMNASLFWTSTFDPTTKKTLSRGVNTKDPGVSYYQASKTDAFPVRCVKD